MTTVHADVRVVPARREHAPFIAWVIMAAARSHLPRGFWDLYIDKTEDDVLRYLEALTTTGKEHFAHYTGFTVAEVGGEPAAGLSGYFQAERGMPALLEGVAEANQATGMTEEEAAAGTARASSIFKVATDHVGGAWIVEWVATRPEFRRRGLVDRLMGEILESGRERGASTADIGVLIGNDPAQRAYEKAGFEVIDEKRHPEFEAAYGSPGIRLLRRAI
jgi:ribosomal protein S18 acetylase RimI-like enzyme